MCKKVLVLGATGAMGVYLIPELLKRGYQVDAVALDAMVSDCPQLNCIQANCKDLDFQQKILKNGYDAIVDFMVYFSKEEFSAYYKMYLENTKQYVFLSTYRVYSDLCHTITEDSPRIYDVTTDEVLLNSGDYCIYKAQEEEMLKYSGYNNWTILRPAITYSKKRFQLTTLEANVLVYRMLHGKTVVLPEAAMDKEATMSWAGDVAKMISALILNEAAFGEIYTVSTAEHHTWREIAEMYKEIGGLKYITVDTETYLDIVNPGNIHSRQQLIYDRLYDRRVDNSKILKIAGMTQSELMPLYEGIKLEFSKLKSDTILPAQPVNDRMDRYLMQFS